MVKLQRKKGSQQMPRRTTKPTAPKSPKSSRKSAKDGESDVHVTCSVCLEVFEDLIFLSCGHAICAKCLPEESSQNDVDHSSKKRRRVTKKEAEESFFCSICQQQCLKISLEDFISNQSRNPRENISSNTGPLCDRCGTNKCAFACASCNFMYCTTCSNEVHSKLFSKHELQKLESFQDTAYSIIQQLSRAKTVGEIRTALDSFGTSGRSLVQKLQTKLYKIEGEGNSVEQTSKELTDEINEKMDLIVSAVQSRKSALLDQLQQWHAKQVSSAAKETKELKTMSEGLESVVNNIVPSSMQTEENNNAATLQGKSDKEILEMKSQLMDLLKQVKNVPAEAFSYKLYLEPDPVVSQISKLGSLFELRNDTIQLDPENCFNQIQISSDRLSASGKTVGGYGFVRGLPALHPGGTYSWRVRVDTKSKSYGPSIGVCLGSADIGNSWDGDETDWWFLDSVSSWLEIYGNGSSDWPLDKKGQYCKSLKAGDVVTVHLDMVKKEIVWTVNNEDPKETKNRISLPSNLTEPVYPLFGLHSGSEISIV